MVFSSSFTCEFLFCPPTCKWRYSCGLLGLFEARAASLGVPKKTRLFLDDGVQPKNDMLLSYPCPTPLQHPDEAHRVCEHPTFLERTLRELAGTVCHVVVLDVSIEGGVIAVWLT